MPGEIDPAVLRDRYRLAAATLAQSAESRDLADLEFVVIALAVTVVADPRLGLDQERQRLAGEIAVDVVYAARQAAGTGRRRSRRLNGSPRACHGFPGRLARAVGW